MGALVARPTVMLGQRWRAPDNLQLRSQRLAGEQGVPGAAQPADMHSRTLLHAYVHTALRSETLRMTSSLAAAAQHGCRMLRRLLGCCRLVATPVVLDDALRLGDHIEAALSLHNVRLGLRTQL